MQLRDEQTPDHVGRKEKSSLSSPNSLKKGGLYTKCHGKGPQQGKMAPGLPRALSVQDKAHSHLGQCHWSPGSNQGHSPPSLTSPDFAVSIYENEDLRPV